MLRVSSTGKEGPRSVGERPDQARAAAHSSCSWVTGAGRPPVETPLNALPEVSMSPRLRTCHRTNVVPVCHLLPHHPHTYRMMSEEGLQRPCRRRAARAVQLPKHSSRKGERTMARCLRCSISEVTNRCSSIARGPAEKQEKQLRETDPRGHPRRLLPTPAALPPSPRRLRPPPAHQPRWQAAPS